MARIRTIKPEFFRHEGLQDLESSHPNFHVMLVFAALWGHCDKRGCFEWRPRQLELDILPYLDFCLADTLMLLEKHGYVRRFESQGKIYGFVPTFSDHQRVSGKEAQEKPKCPEPKDFFPIASQGSTGEAVETTGMEGKGREKEGKGLDAPSATKYAWQGNLIRLSVADFAKIKKNYKSIPDFEAELFAIDAYYTENPPKDGNWYWPMMGWLKREHQKHAAMEKKSDDFNNMFPGA